METLLIVGADTLAGANLAQQLAGRCQLHALAWQPGFCLTGSSRPVEVASADGSDCPGRLEAWKPDHIIYCGSLSASSWDLAAASEAWQYEATRVAAWTAAAASHRVALSVLSTDAVFGGPRLFHGEDANPCGTHPAARWALAMEQAALAGGALVLRSHMYGWAPMGLEPGLVEQIWEDLLAGATPRCDGRSYATPIFVADLAALLERAHELKLRGLYHLTGAERTSPFRLATELASAAGLTPPRGRMILGASPLATQAGETSLNCRRARRALDRPMPLLRDGLSRFIAEAAQHRTAPLTSQAA